jgi:large subunit ribosomal protein L10
MRRTYTLNREQKTELIQRLSTSLGEAPSIVVASFSGLTVEATDELRSRMRAADVSYEVVKNTLIKRAVAGTSKETIAPLLKGTTAIAYHSEDPGAPAKILRDFIKDHKKGLTIKGGWVDGTLLDESGVEMLSKLPGRDELRGSLLRVLNGAATQFVRVLNAAPGDFVQVLRARKESLEG